MWSVCSSLQVILVPPWKQKSKLLCHHSKKSTSLKKFPTFYHHITNSFSKDDSSSSSTPNQNQLGYDPSEELFGIPPRDVKKSDAPEPRSWFGPNGQYIKELPCPSCRGRGYTPCTECGIERSRQDCPICSGKGIMTCQHCLGECVIWEESIDEIPWEKARSISPLTVKEDDEVDNMELKLGTRKKSKRVYRSTPPEVGLKISRSLKSLNAQTGMFSKRMKIIHRDPTLHAQRVAAIKKAKGTAAARKHTSESLKAFFSDPENRRKRSISMKGVKFFCKTCGQEGHRRNYCPNSVENTDRRFKCGLCGKKGHNRRTCQKPRTSKLKQRHLGEYHCRACGKVGHNRRTCSLKAKVHLDRAAPENKGPHEDSNGHARKHHHRCSVCGKSGHNKATCSQHSMKEVAMKSRGSRTHHRCSVCGKSGHNKATCTQHLMKELSANSRVCRTSRRPYHCRKCGVLGHNRRTCTRRAINSVDIKDESTL